MDWGQNIAATIGLLVVIGFFGWLVNGWLSKRRIYRVANGQGTAVKILVTQLDNDDDQNPHQHTIRQCLETQFRSEGHDSQMRVEAYPAILKPVIGENGQTVNDVLKTGRKWLQLQKANILIWGEVVRGGEMLRLRFTTHGLPTFEAEPYSLNENFELPADFVSDFGVVLAIIGIGPMYQQRSQSLATIIEPVVSKLKPLAVNPPSSFSDDAKAMIWHAYAYGEWRLGNECDDNDLLTVAIAFFRKALSLMPQERSPRNWAMAQNNLGNALARLGERESGTGTLKLAVEAYHNALKEQPRERAPLEWAMTQSNLGLALFRLGERESGNETLKLAVKACQRALEELPRERVPLD